MHQSHTVGLLSCDKNTLVLSDGFSGSGIELGEGFLRFVRRQALVVNVSEHELNQHMLRHSRAHQLRNRSASSDDERLAVGFGINGEPLRALFRELLDDTAQLRQRDSTFRLLASEGKAAQPQAEVLLPQSQLQQRETELSYQALTVLQLSNRREQRMK